MSAISPQRRLWQQETFPLTAVKPPVISELVPSPAVSIQNTAVNTQMDAIHDRKRMRRGYVLAVGSRTSPPWSGEEEEEEVADKHRKQRDSIRASAHSPSSYYAEANKLLYELHLTRMQSRYPPPNSPWSTSPSSCKFDST